MGTRNLTCVVVDGEMKVAQYGQWDGYPEGQGATCCEFIQETDMIVPDLNTSGRSVGYVGAMIAVSDGSTQTP